jgi:hypothetical protein
MLKESALTEIFLSYDSWKGKLIIRRIKYNIIRIYPTENEYFLPAQKILVETPE